MAGLLRSVRFGTRGARSRHRGAAKFILRRGGVRLQLDVKKGVIPKPEEV